MSLAENSAAVGVPTGGAAHVVATAGSSDPSAPLVVLLHGRGSTEREILGLADHLPQGFTYAAVRAPIAEGSGYAWFANRGIGCPTPESLAEQMAWFRGWLDTFTPAGRPVILVGLSCGAAFAGGLILDDPQRYSGAAILYGTLPFDAGVPVTPARLEGLPVCRPRGPGLSFLLNCSLGPGSIWALSRRPAPMSAVTQVDTGLQVRR